MTHQPDEDHDVIVQQRRQRDGRDTWTIWLAGEKQGERASLESAIELAPRRRRHAQPAGLAARRDGVSA